MNEKRVYHWLWPEETASRSSFHDSMFILVRASDHVATLQRSMFIHIAFIQQLLGNLVKPDCSHTDKANLEEPVLCIGLIVCAISYCASWTLLTEWCYCTQSYEVKHITNVPLSLISHRPHGYHTSPYNCYTYYCYYPTLHCHYITIKFTIHLCTYQQCRYNDN